MVAPDQMLKTLLTSPHDHQTLEEASVHAEAITKYLESSDEEFDPELQQVIQTDPEWAERVFARIMESTSPAPAPPLDRCTQEKIQDDEDIGRAFRDVLVPGLRDKLRDWSNIFADTIAEEYQRLLAERPDVRAAQPASQPLLRYGVTPLTIFYATEGVRSLVRMRRRANEQSKLVLSRSAAGDSQTLTRLDVVPAIQRYSACTESIAGSLFHWLIQVAREGHPHLFRSFQASPHKLYDVSLVPAREEKGIVDRWTHVATASHSGGMESVLRILQPYLTSRQVRTGSTAEEPSSATDSAEAWQRQPISQLNLSVRARKCMSRLGISTVGDLVQLSSHEILQVKNFGMTTLAEVRNKLQQHGLKLKND